MHKINIYRRIMSRGIFSVDAISCTTYTLDETSQYDSNEKGNLDNTPVNR